MGVRVPKWKLRGRGSATELFMTFGGLRRRLNEHQQPAEFRRVKRAENWRKKGGCRQRSLLGIGGRRVDADREAYWELEEEGWMQIGKHTWNRKEKGGCRQSCLLGTGGRIFRVNFGISCSIVHQRRREVSGVIQGGRRPH